MVFIYVLQLEEGKYYIGKTNNPSFRLENHFNSNGSAWTKKYKPTKVLELIPDCDDYDEDKYTRKYMDKYGMNNVRGGSFCEIKLNDNNLITLKQMSNGTNNKCFTCGEEGHFTNNCKKKETKQTDNLLNEKCNCPTSYFSPHRRSKCLLNNLIKQTSNLETFIDNDSDEYETDDSDEYETDDSDEYEEVWCCENCDKQFDEEHKCEYHEKYCNKKSNKNVICYRCGREGHYATTCYASKHVKGYYLK
jgi:predicted GIY-YIG superfamily endonuclease